MTNIESEYFSVDILGVDCFSERHQCSSNGIKNKLLMTRIPTSIPIVQMFDFMYFNGFI